MNKKNKLSTKKIQVRKKIFYVFKIFLFISLLLIFKANCIAQSKAITYHEYKPIKIIIDSLSPQKGSWGDYIIQYFPSDQSRKLIEIFRINASSNEIGKIIEIKWNNQLIYIVPIYELLVGYDYCIIIRQSPFNYFISNKFNYNGEKYTVYPKNLNLNKSPFFIFVLKNNRIEKLTLKMIK